MGKNYYLQTFQVSDFHFFALNLCVVGVLNVFVILNVCVCIYTLNACIKCMKFM